VHPSPCACERRPPPLQPPRAAFNKVTEQATSRWTLERARIINSLEADIPAWLWKARTAAGGEPWLVQRCKYWADLGGMQLEVEVEDPKKCANDERAAKVAEVCNRARARLNARSAAPAAAAPVPPATVRAASTPLLSSPLPAPGASLPGSLATQRVGGAGALASPPAPPPSGQPPPGAATVAAPWLSGAGGDADGAGEGAIGIVPRGSVYGTGADSR
jgi:hypothetical protein